MKKSITGILPAGAPWGGPESIRFISCSTSIYMYLKQPDQFQDELFCIRSERLCERCGRCRNYDWHRKMHEQIYHELLTLSGLCCRTLWDPELRPESLSDLTRSVADDEAIERAMAFAGLEFRMAENLSAEAMRQLIVESLERDVPVAARGLAGSDWCLITGYEHGGEQINGFYAPHPWEELETHDEHQFSRSDWHNDRIRLLLVTGECPARVPDHEEFSHLRRSLIDSGTPGCISGLAAFDHCIELLSNDVFFAEVNDRELCRIFSHLHDFIGLLAESRCFTAFTFFSGFHGKIRQEDLFEWSRKIGSIFMETHEDCWKAWELLGGDHIPKVEDYAPRLRKSATRRNIIEYLREFKQNDWNAVLLLEAMINRSSPD